MALAYHPVPNPRKIKSPGTTAGSPFPDTRCHPKAQIRCATYKPTDLVGSLYPPTHVTIGFTEYCSPESFKTAFPDAQEFYHTKNSDQGRGRPAAAAGRCVVTKLHLLGTLCGGHQASVLYPNLLGSQVRSTQLARLEAWFGRCSS